MFSSQEQAHLPQKRAAKLYSKIACVNQPLSESHFTNVRKINRNFSASLIAEDFKTSLVRIHKISK